MTRTFFRFFDRPTNPNERRRSCRYDGVENPLFLGWWEGSRFQTTTAVLKDVSLGGASILVDASPPVHDHVWISLRRARPAEWVEATIVETERGPRRGLFTRGLTQLRLQFIDNCSYDFFEFMKSGMVMP